MGVAASVLIRGDGVAGYCCARLLRNAGLRVSIEHPERHYVPAVMLGDQALALIRDVAQQPNLFNDLPRIDRRIVAWGDKAGPSSVRHSAVVVSEKSLLEKLAVPFDAGAGFSPDFTIHASRQGAALTAPRRFGSRRAVAVQVELKDLLELSACQIESLDDGWLFLIPNALDSTWLLAIGAPLEHLLENSRVIAAKVELRGARSGEFDACPAMATAVHGDDWLACGTAAMSFDPVCGDGVASAIREAILASGVIVAMIKGGDAPSLFAHYEAMLTGAMRRHLKLCAEFYHSGGNGAWWRGELEALIEGYNWCTAQLATAAEPKYQLRGFELVART